MAQLATILFPSMEVAQHGLAALGVSVQAPVWQGRLLTVAGTLVSEPFDMAWRMIVPLPAEAYATYRAAEDKRAWYAEQVPNLRRILEHWSALWG